MMDEAEARKILGSSIQSDGRLYNGGYLYMHWDRTNSNGSPNAGITLDAIFTVEELEAIVWWMKNVSLIIITKKTSQSLLMLQPIT